jgi:predicted RNase H-like HicB family nuclease
MHLSIEPTERRGFMQVLFNLFGTLKREGNWYIAHCPPLDLTTQGRTITEAKQNLIEASELFLISCIERGTLDQAMKELGFVPLKSERVIKHRLGPNVFRVPVSIPFALQKNVQCHA